MSESRTTEQKYFDVKNKQLETINQTVHMTDVIMGYNVYPFLAPTQDCDTLIKQLKFLTDTTRFIHNNLYADPIDPCKTRPGFENHVTRFISNEFSFLSANPIPLSEFNRLINDLKEYLKGSNQNVIYIFSTFSIIDIDQKVYTTILIIQGGYEPIIQTLAKINPLSAETPRWANFSSYRETFKRNSHKQAVEIKPYNYEEEFKTGTPLLLGPNNNHTSWNYYNVFRHSLLGGAEYCFLIDICFDHLFKSAKYNYINMIDSAINHQETFFIPNQVSQILTSNTMDIAANSKVTNRVAFADPLLFYKYKYQPQYEHLDTLKANHSLAPFPKKLSSQQLIDFFNSKKATACYENTSHLFEVKHSNFATPFRLTVHENYNLQQPYDDILEKIQTHNLTILRSYPNYYDKNRVNYESNKKDYFIVNNFFNEYLEWVHKQFKSQYNSVLKTLSNELKLLACYLPKQNFRQQLALSIQSISTNIVADISKKHGKNLTQLATEWNHNEMLGLFIETGEPLTIDLKSRINAKKFSSETDTNRYTKFFYQPSNINGPNPEQRKTDLENNNTDPHLL